MTVPVLRSALLDGPAVRHGFFGREGGLSDGVFSSLNCSDAGGDDATRVAGNRAHACAVLGRQAADLVVLRQVHSTDVVTVTGRPDYGAAPVEGDALVSASRDVVLGILTADCAPVLLADPEAGVIGAAHAGWKGAVGGIVGATIAAMEALGARRERILAAIGPTISGRNYEIGPQLAADLVRLHPPAATHISIPEGREREHFDIPGLLRTQLESAAVAALDDVGQCTYAAPGRWFSHRFATHQGTTTGRQIALICLA